MKNPSFTFDTSDARVLAFARGWSLDCELPETVQAIRERVRTLGCELVVLSDLGVWSFRPEDVEPVGHYTDRLAGDVATAATVFAARGGQDAVFVIDEGKVVRVGDGSAGMVASLESAAELLVRRRLLAVANANALNVPFPSWCPERSMFAIRSRS